MPRSARPLAAGLLPLLAGALAAGGALAQAANPGTAAPGPRAPAPRPAGPAAPDPAFEAARAAFEARPEAERRAVQDALVWAGNYNSVVTGTFGRRTYEAIGAWQARAGASASGVLDEPARAALIAAGDAARRAARFTVAPDPATGLVIGVPERLLAKRSRLPGGSRWQSPDGRVTLDTRAFAPGETDLEAVFAQASAAAPERKVTYTLKRPDFVVVTGETPGGKFYIRYAAGPAGLRGFSLAYDKGSAREMDRLAIAIANSFSPFPGETPAAAARPAVAASDPAPSSAGQAQGQEQGQGPGSGTGLVVGPRRIVTVLPGSCAAPQAAGRPARILRRDEAGGLALLDAPTPSVPPPALAPAPAAPGEAAILLASGADGPTVTTGEFAAGGVLAPLQPGGAGAPVLDRSGRLLGLVARPPAQPRLVAGVLPPLTHPIVGADALRTFLGPDVPAAPAGEARPLSTGAVAARLAGAVVPVRCGP